MIHGRHDHHRRPAAPGLAEAGDLVGGLLLGVDQHRVGAGPVIGLRPAQRLVHAPAGNQRLDARHDLKVVVALAVLARFDAAAELVHVRQRLVLADEGVGLWEQLVLDADPRNATLAQLPHQAAHVVEIAVAGVAIHEDGDRGGVGHELQHFEDLGPGGLVVVAHAERGRHREARGPDALEPGLFHDLGGEPVVRLHDEGEGRGVEQAAQAGGLGHRGSLRVRAADRKPCRHGESPVRRLFVHEPDVSR